MIKSSLYKNILSKHISLYISYFIFTTQKFTKSKTKIKFHPMTGKRAWREALTQLINTISCDRLWSLFYTQRIYCNHPSWSSQSFVPNIPPSNLYQSSTDFPPGHFFSPARLPGNLKGCFSVLSLIITKFSTIMWLTQFIIEGIWPGPSVNQINLFPNCVERCHVPRHQPRQVHSCHAVSARILKDILL